MFSFPTLFTFLAGGFATRIIWKDSATISLLLSGGSVIPEGGGMIEYLKTWLELKTDDRAVTALEYGVIAGVLAVVVVTAFTTLGTGLNNAFTHVSKQM
jgi:pilus assembly protein Flp/PilA